jgi:hypothetical protein
MKVSPTKSDHYRRLNPLTSNQINHFTRHRLYLYQDHFQKPNKTTYQSIACHRPKRRVLLKKEGGLVC